MLGPFLLGHLRATFLLVVIFGFRSPKGIKRVEGLRKLEILLMGGV
jgi:hypothetical protein